MKIIHAALLTLLLGTGCAFVPKTSTPVTSTSEPEDSKSLRELAENGNARAQYKLGLNYVNGGNEEATEDDTGGYKEAFKWWRKAAQRNHPHAQYYLGVMYSNGLGVGMVAQGSRAKSLPGPEQPWGDVWQWPRDTGRSRDCLRLV